MAPPQARCCQCRIVMMLRALTVLLAAIAQEAHGQLLMNAALPMCRPDGTTCPILIDVRTADEWNGGHASCATRIPVQDDPSLVSEILDLAGGDTSIPIITYCYSGARAGAAEAIIGAAGFADVTNGGGFISPPGNDAVLEEMCTCDTPCAGSSCAEDINSDGTVDVNDLLAMLSGYAI
jgi:phage shock protein E